MSIKDTVPLIRVEDGGGVEKCMLPGTGSVCIIKIYQHTGQCKRTGGCYNELVVAFFSTGGGVKGKKIYTC